MQAARNGGLCQAKAAKRRGGSAVTARTCWTSSVHIPEMAVVVAAEMAVMMATEMAVMVATEMSGTVATEMSGI